MVALWILSILDAYIHSGQKSIPVFNTFVKKSMGLEAALVIFLGALSCLDFGIPHLIAKGPKVSLLMPAIPIATALVLDPITGGLAAETLHA